MTDEHELLIDHARIMDGFGELQGQRTYLPFATFCGICDTPLVLSAREQKYLLEVKGVPVKRLRAGAAFCAQCAARRGRINEIARGERWRHVQEGEAELAKLRTEERDAQAQSHQRYLHAEWPYAAR